MDTLLHLLAALMPLGYGLAAVNYQVFFVRRDAFAKRTCTPFLMAIVLLHGLYLALQTLQYQRAPLVGMSDALSMIAFSVALVYLYVERVQRNQFTGAFILPLVVLTQLVASATIGDQPTFTSQLLSHPVFGVHALLALVGYSAFAVGAVYAVMFLMLYRALKQQRFGLLFDRLPALDELAAMGFWAGFLGWVALTITIMLGIFMSIELVPGLYADTKFYTTVIVWMVYGVAAIAYFFLGWRGTRTAYIALLGFIIAVVTMIGSNYIWPSFHSFQA